MTTLGRQAVALPPLASDGEHLLWGVPQWFTYHAQSISLLRENLEAITSSEKPIYKAELHAILFLMRLQILLGDRDAAVLHFYAVQEATQHAAIVPDLQVDLAMWKIDMVMIYLNPEHVVQKSYVRAEDPLQQQPLFYIRDLEAPGVDQLTQQIADKAILWQGIHLNYEPGLSCIVDDFVTADFGFGNFPEPTQETLQSCLYISRYLLAYLRYMSADTSHPMVQQLVRHLQGSIDLLPISHSDLWRQIPRLMFYLMFTGVFASHGNREARKNFVFSIQRNLNCSRDDSCDHARNILGRFLDLSTINDELFQSAWESIVQEN